MGPCLPLCSFFFQTTVSWEGDQLVCEQLGEKRNRGWRHWLEGDQLHLVRRGPAQLAKPQSGWVGGHTQSAGAAGSEPAVQPSSHCARTSAPAPGGQPAFAQTSAWPVQKLMQVRGGRGPARPGPAARPAGAQRGSGRGCGSNAACGTPASTGRAGRAAAGERKQRGIQPKLLFRLPFPSA